MTEVFSTSGFAFDFSVADMKRKKSSAKELKPKKTLEEKDAEFKSKVEAAVNRDGGRYIEFIDGIGMLVAATKHRNKYYFVWLDRDRKLQFTDANETYHILRNVPISMGIVDYLVHSERKTLADKVINFFKEEESYKGEDKYILVGNINLGPKRNIPRDMQRKKKRTENTVENNSDENQDKSSKKKTHTRSKNRKSSSEVKKK